MALTEKQQESLHAWVDGDLSPAQGRKVQRLLKDARRGREARAYVEEIRRLGNSSRAPQVPLPSGLQARVLAALDDEPGHSKLPVISAVVILAGAVFALSAAFGPVLLDSSGASDMPAVNSPPETAAGKDTELDMSLTDAPPVAACADLMLIGFLYGEADLVNDADGFARVDVVLRRRRLPAFVAAVNVLAERQGYGRVEAPPELLAKARAYRDGAQATSAISMTPPQAPPDVTPKIKLCIYLR